MENNYEVGQIWRLEWDEGVCIVRIIHVPCGEWIHYMVIEHTNPRLIGKKYSMWRDESQSETHSRTLLLVYGTPLYKVINGT
jgi:hypothetical protein